MRTVNNQTQSSIRDQVVEEICAGFDERIIEDFKTFSPVYQSEIENIPLGGQCFDLLLHYKRYIDQLLTSRAWVRSITEDVVAKHEWLR